MTTCPHCRWRDDLPAPALLLARRDGTSERVYTALLNGDRTADELREIAWPGHSRSPTRKPGTLRTMLTRLEKRLSVYGIAIARIGSVGDECIYRLVPTKQPTITGLWDKLTPEQQANALAYRGEEKHGGAR